jgi:hypothetical protein
MQLYTLSRLVRGAASVEARQRLKYLSLPAAAALALLASCSYAEDDLRYTLGSSKADDTLAEYLNGAKYGNTHAHLYLAKLLCGDVCVKSDLRGLPEGTLKALQKRRELIKELDIQPDFVRAYAHYMLADDFKSGFEGSRQKLEEHMNDTQIRTAKRLASAWKADAEGRNRSNRQGGRP